MLFLGPLSKSSRPAALLLLGQLLSPSGHWAEPKKCYRVAFYIWSFHLPNVCLVTHATKCQNKLHNPLYGVVVNRVKFHMVRSLCSFNQYCDHEACAFLFSVWSVHFLCP